jgi:hypothetical protein
MKHGLVTLGIAPELTPKYFGWAESMIETKNPLLLEESVKIGSPVHNGLSSSNMLPASCILHFHLMLSPTSSCTFHSLPSLYHV